MLVKNNTVDIALRALAEENRRRIIRLIVTSGMEATDCNEELELCVCEIAANIDVSPATLSHHLSVLKEAGLICDRRQGRRIYYRIKKEAITKVKEVIDGLC